MRRRQFLAGSTALLPVALAGCGHPPVVLDMEEATASDVADEVSMAPQPEAEEYRVVAAARETNSTTRRGRYELFDRTDVVQVDGAFYEVTETRLAESEVTVYEVLLDYNPENTTADLGEIAYEDLPEADRQRLDQIVTEETPPSQEGVDVGVGYGSAEEVGNESVFVPERQYDIVVYDGNRYRVAVESQTATEAEYRYEVTEVASSVEGFAEQVRAQYLFTLTGLSDAERDVVEQAIDGGYFEDDEAFRSVVDRIREQEAVRRDDFYGTWLLDYEGVEYVTYVEW